MKIAILSQGPSAAAYSGHTSGGNASEEPYEVVIGVNRQAAAWPCTWWAANDADTLRTVEPQGDPVIWTKAAALSDLADNHLAAFLAIGERRIRTHELEAMGTPRNFLWELVPRWNLFTGLAAMGLAILLCSAADAPSIDLYGYDMHGEQDFTGNTHPCRTPGRWAQEAEILDRLIQVAHGRGIRVSRIHP